jgi:hypothetical protein
VRSRDKPPVKNAQVKTGISAKKALATIIWLAGWPLDTNFRIVSPDVISMKAAAPSSIPGRAFRSRSPCVIKVLAAWRLRQGAARNLVPYNVMHQG